MHIWLWSSRLFSVKPTLSYLFKTLLQHLKKWDKYGMKTIVSTTLVHPSKFYLEKLEWWDPPLTSLFSCSELSVTGDTAKYLDWHSAEVVHFHHKTSSTHSDLDLLEVKRKGWDEDETFPKYFPDHCRPDALHLLSSTTTCQAGPVPL